MGMRIVLQSIWTWGAIWGLIVLWVPLLALIRVFDRDPAHYRTGRWFRRLGLAMTKVNPACRSRFPERRLKTPALPTSWSATISRLPTFPSLAACPGR